MHTDRRTFLKTTAGLSAVALVPGASAIAYEPLAAPINVGVIGVGRQGRDMLTEIGRLADVAVAVVCDTDERRRDLAARRARGVDQAAEYRAVLDRDDINAVIIATPTHLHKQIAVDALAAGKHVYCEAPLAHTVEDCQQIARAARDSDRIFQTGMQGRSNPIYKLARSFVVAGSIRETVGLRAQSHQKTSWRLPPDNPARDLEVNWRLDPAVSLGLAGELGVHQFDVFHWFLSKYPVRVSGGGAIRLHNDGREVPDTIHCTFTFDNGVALQYDATLANSYESTHELFLGTMGTVKLTWTHGWMFREADAPTEGWQVYANRQRFHNEEGITLIADATQLAAQGRLQEGVGLEHSSLYYALSDFAQAIDKGRAVPCTAEEGLRAAAVAIAARDAVRSGSTVEINHDQFRVG